MNRCIVMFFILLNSKLIFSAGRYGPTRLDPWTKEDCFESCSSNPAFDPALQCGGGFLPTKVGIVNALLTQNPEIAQCLLNIRDGQGVCRDRCSAMREVFRRAPKAAEKVTPRVIDISVVPQPSTHIISNWTSNKFTPTETHKWHAIGVPLALAIELRGKGISPEQAATVAEAIDVSQFERKEVLVNGAWLHHNKRHWGFAIKWKRKRWGWLVAPTRPHGPAPSMACESNGGWQFEEHNNSPEAILADAKAYFAGHLGIPVDSILEVQFPSGGRGEGNLGAIGHRWRYVWDNYRFTVYYRKARLTQPITKAKEHIRAEVPYAYCPKCNKKATHKRWSDGWEGTLYSGLCEACYKVFVSLPHDKCGRCGKLEKYHLWKDGWSGDCFNGLCEYCTTGHHHLLEEEDHQPSTEQQIKSLKSKIDKAELQFQNVYLQYRNHYVANAGLDAANSSDAKFKHEPWYREHTRLWQIQSDARGDLDTLKKRLKRLLVEQI